jgi:hypothetical protein
VCRELGSTSCFSIIVDKKQDIRQYGTLWFVLKWQGDPVEEARVCTM